jgi:pimeloyl-ACP methyl ester carboxylesterase
VFGGNGSLALDWLDFLTDYPDPGSAFLLVEYPGYGNSEGSASPETILEASRSAFAELTRRFPFPETGMTGGVHLLGHSLGAGAALEFAAAMPVRSLLLVAPFTSLREMAARAVGLPLGFLLLHNFDNRARLREILVAPVVPKVVIIHGENDQVVPIEMGRALAQEFTALEYVEIPGGDHNALLMLERSLIHARMFKISGL